jgi:hypothetical protein
VSSIVINRRFPEAMQACVICMSYRVGSYLCGRGIQSQFDSSVGLAIRFLTAIDV